ncbi:DUF4181 domain-containing protein [Lysinibacillus sp. NPDC096418]|uniref:DUF4181 domain-containing protein n=1 Tax=Lysinibacillus sp. NPDC096418 TaxID=3364138 RepID=UPI0037FE49FC
MNNEFLIFIIILIGLWFCIVTFSLGMRKILKVERKKWFSYNHINDVHKKIDWAIRITFTILVLAYTFYLIFTNSPEFTGDIELWMVFLVFLVVTESVRAYMEWRYVENRKAYVLTIIEMVFFIALFTLMMKTNFFGLFT